MRLQFTSGFIRKYLLPAGMVIALFLSAVFLMIRNGPPAGTWQFYTLVVIVVVTAIFLVLLMRQVLTHEAMQQAAAIRLAEADEKYRSLLETSADGLLFIMDGKVAFANYVFMAMSGYTQKELRDMKVEELMKGKEREGLSLEKLDREAGETGRTLNLEARIAGKRGGLRDVALALSKIAWMEKEGYIIVIRDVSGRERIEQESMHLRHELQSSILMMNLPIASFTREFLSCDMGTPIHEAASLMQRKDRDALILTRERDKPVGIVTDSDLRDRVIAKQKDYGDPVFEVMSSPLVRIPEQSLLYEGILQMKAHTVSHLVVEDRNGRIAGIFSNKDLLEVQHNSISYLIREVNAADTVESLKKIHNKIPVLVKILLESGARIQNVTHMISTVSDAITHRLIDFAIEEMGEPPARFAFLALGSEGRREQTLITDQDNAIVIEDVPNEKASEVNRYFLYFGKKINLWLDRIGYQYCRGEVMAGNPQWCQPLSRWKSYFTNWVREKSPDGVLGMAVFFDFRIVYGEEQLAADLRQHIQSAVRGSETFLSHLAREVAEYEIPTDIFRGNGQDAKAALPDVFNAKNALSPITDFIRVYALHNRVSETNSMQRLEKLRRLNILTANDSQELENIYCHLMEIRFRSQVNAILSNRVPDNTVGKEELTAIEQTMVRKAFSEITSFQGMILHTFGT